MLVTFVTIALLVVAPQPKASALPDTPQGRHVAAWLSAFNSGDEKTFIAAHHEHMTRAVLEKRPDAERAKMFQRMRGDFGEIKVEKVIKATEKQIQFAARTTDGSEATFTFDFEEKAPFLIAGIGIDVRGGGLGSDLDFLNPTL